MSDIGYSIGPLSLNPGPTVVFVRWLFFKKHGRRVKKNPGPFEFVFEDGMFTFNSADARRQIMVSFDYSLQHEQASENFQLTETEGPL